MTEIVYRGRVHGLQIAVARGSICELPIAVDCVMVSGNTEGKMGGGVSKAVLSACDPSLEAEAERRRPQLGSVAFLPTSGHLAKSGVRAIAYAAILRKPVDNGSLGSVRDALSNFRDLADRQSVRSVAIPLMGSKIGRLDSLEVARVIVQALPAMFEHCGIRTVVLSAVTDEDITAFVRAVNESFPQPLEDFGFVVVDMISQFVGPGKLISSGLGAELAVKINEFAQFARSLDRPVVFVRDVHDAADPELMYTRVHSVNEEVRLLDQLTVAPTDLVVDKNTYAAFFETPLSEHLRERGCGTVVFAGTQTHVCVKYSALLSMFEGFRPVVLSDLCASSSTEMHDAGLAEVSRYFGEVAASDVITRCLEELAFQLA
jgi:nicotinamidase-related amidase/O-acetyl-ADP-ribose deacetylase (regulator of RNase III)